MERPLLFNFQLFRLLPPAHYAAGSIFGFGRCGLKPAAPFAQ